MYRAKVWNFVKSASFWDAFPNDRPRLTLTYGFLISRLIEASSCPAILQRNAHHSGAGVFTPHKQQSLLVIAGRWFPTIPRARVWPKKLTKPLFASFLTWTLLRFKFLILIFNSVFYKRVSYKKNSCSQVTMTRGRFQREHTTRKWKPMRPHS